jgi:hypothetical protein
LNKSVLIGYCGVCCSHCGMQAHIPNMTEELKRFVDTYGYDEWIEHITQDFDFENFMKGLEWFANSGCSGCLQGGGMPTCEVRKCCIEKGLKNCYFCKGFLNCEKLSYQKETYKIDENYKRIKQIGYENWLEEQEEKSRQDFDNIHFLEK